MQIHRSVLLTFCQELEDISVEDEMEDSFSDKEEDLGAVEEERSVILHLLSQLKLGMDLTRVGPVPHTAFYFSHSFFLSEAFIFFPL